MSYGSLDRQHNRNTGNAAYQCKKLSSAYYQYCTWRINPADSVRWRPFNALIMVSIEDTARGKMAWLLKWKWMIYIQLWASYCLTHKAICFCSYFQLITLTERAHSLSSDEVWWWRLMMSASSHHHLASSTLFPLLVAAIEAIFVHSLRVIVEYQKPLLPLKDLHNTMRVQSICCC